MPTTRILAIALGVALTAGGAIAHDISKLPNTPAGKAVLARHNNFKQQGAAFKAINDELKKDRPDEALIASNAIRLKTLTSQLPSWFPKGSGPSPRLNTDAKATIWTDSAGFAAAVNRMQVESSKLQQFAAAGDIGGMNRQARAVGGACKACHDKFRTPAKD